MKLRGVCMHHDQGALGAVANATAIERQMRMMKEMGANAIRVSHNPADPDLLRICDELGLMVVEEAYDGWKSAKDKGDFAGRFDTLYTHPDAEDGVTWGEFDLQQMIRKSRNSPSIIMWSIGNEVYDNNSWGEEWVREAVDTLIPAVDPAGHYVTMGENGFKRNSYNPTNSRGKMANTIDVVGLNYSEEKYDFFRQTEPDWLIYGSETASAVGSRGMYSHPEVTGRPTSGVDGVPQYVGEEQLSSFDNGSVKWGRTATGAYIYDRDRKWIAGQFVWTGFDYIGEPSPFGSKGGSATSGPKSSYFGIVDTAGFPKDNYYLYQSQWLDVETEPMVHLLPHWNWEDKELRDLVTYTSGANKGEIPMRVYSNAPAVELFVDGVSQGKKEFAQKTTDYGYRYQQQSEDSVELYLEWPLTWSEKTGTKIEAVAYNAAGEEIACDAVVTADKPAKLEVSADRTIIKADGYDLSYITVDVQDENGNFVPNANNEILFRVSGNGKIVGVDNGDGASWERYKDYNGTWKRKAFSGKALVIVQSTEDMGSFTLTASSAGLQSDTVTVYTTKTTPDDDTVMGYEVESRTVNVGTKLDELRLPETVNAVKADGSEFEVAVSWEMPTEAQLAQPGALTVKGETSDNAAVTLTLVVRGPMGVRPVSVVTGLNQAPVLPDTASVVWSDGSTEEKAVTWEPVPEEELNTAEHIFQVEGTVEGYPHFHAVANIRVTLGTEINIALPANGGEIKNPSGDAGNAYLLTNDGWDKQDSWHPSSTTASVEIHFDKPYQIGKTTIYYWKKAYQVPDTLEIEYAIGDGEWTSVANQAASTGFELYVPVDITFDTVRADRLKFTFRVDKFDAGLSQIGVSEIKVYGKMVQMNSTATLRDLQVDGETVPGFDPAVYGYLIPLAYDAGVPEVTAETADGASCFIRQALTANGAAVAEVVSEDGTAMNTYTVQFSQKAPMLQSVKLEEIGSVTEDDVIALKAVGIMQDGTEAPADEISVTYTVEDGTGHAEVRNGLLYAYTAGTVNVTAHMAYQGNTVHSDPKEIHIAVNTAEKQIVSFDATSVRTVPGTAPALPEQVTAYYDIGLPRPVNVQWDAVDEAKYAVTGRFTVEGTVAGTILRPAITVDVVGMIAAENISMGVVEGYEVNLPAQTTVYFSDGTTDVWEVEWDISQPEELDGVTVYHGTVTDSGESIPVKASIRTAEAEQSNNYALKFNGWGLPDGLASFTNDTDVNSGGKDKATYLNDGDKSFVLNNDKKVWTNYVPSSVDKNKVPREEDWAGVVIAESGQILEKTVDTFCFGVLDEKQTYYSVKLPEDYFVEYYTGPAFEYAYTTDQILHDGQVANAYGQNHWPNSPLNDPDNWQEVEYTDKDGQESEKPVLTEEMANTMVDVFFKPVKASVIRVRLKAQDKFCVGINEIETYGRIPIENNDVTGTSIQVNGQDRTADFEENALTIKLARDEAYPIITASVQDNAAVTVIPATDLNPVTTVRFVPEDGSERNIQVDQITFVREDEPNPEQADLQISYNAKNAKLWIDGEEQKLANLIGSYVRKNVPDDEDFTLAFTPIVEGRTFRAVAVNGGMPQIIGADSYIYEAKMDTLHPNIAFVFETVNKMTLKTVIGYAKERIEAGDLNKVVPVVKEAFMAAFDAAEEVYGDPSATQQGIDDAWIRLMDRIHLLSFTPGGKIDLEDLIKTALTLYENDYITAAWDKFEVALAETQKIMADENALQNDVDQAHDALYRAMVALLEAGRADRTQLDEVMEQAESINLDEYLDTGKAAFIAALEAAQAIGSDATQAEVNAAAQELSTAMSALRKIPKREELEGLLARMDQTDLSDYTASSAAVHSAARANLAAILADPNAAPEAWAAAYDAALLAEKGLVRKTQSNSKGSSAGSSGNAYGSSGIAAANPVVSAAQSVAGQSYVHSDTTLPFTLRRGSAYCFKMTVVNGNGQAPSFTVGNGSVLKTQFVAKIGNDYYYRVWAIGTPGQSAGVYTTLPDNTAQKHCTVTIG